jgi:hypothetical protein
VAASGTEPLSWQWYRGAPGDVSSPVAGATSNLFESGPLLTDASFWARGTNACGHADSVAATVTIQRNGRRRPVRH